MDLPAILMLCRFLSARLTVSFLPKVSQRLPEYGVHFHRVLPEKRSQTGIMLGVYSKGVLIFEVLNGNRTPVLRFPWRDTKKISFAVCTFPERYENLIPLYSRLCILAVSQIKMLHMKVKSNPVYPRLPPPSLNIFFMCLPKEKKDLPAEHIG